jgi:hypothetical protein
MYCYPLPTIYPISSPFGWRTNPVTGKQELHDGVDFACPNNTPILAFSSGTVIFAGTDQFGGLYIDIQHNDGLKTRYVHLSKFDVVKGQIVKKGQQIALSGNTGLSSGPHLHFVTMVNNIAVDPEPLLKNSKIMNQKPTLDAEEMLNAWRANVDIYLRDRGLDLSVIRPEVIAQSENLKFDMAGQGLAQIIIDFLADRERQNDYIKELENEIKELKKNV